MKISIPNPFKFKKSAAQAADEVEYQTIVVEPEVVDPEGTDPQADQPAEAQELTEDQLGQMVEELTEELPEDIAAELAEELAEEQPPVDAETLAEEEALEQELEQEIQAAAEADAAADAAAAAAADADADADADAEAVLGDEPMTDEQKFAYKLIKRAASLKGVKIDREKFLLAELGKRCTPEVAQAAVETTPAQAGVSPELLEDIADGVIWFETAKVSGLSTLAGLPGGLAMAGTVPADLVQYFAHVLRVEQKLAYVYGWQSMLNEEHEVDSQTVEKLILLMGVMMQVGGASVALSKLATQMATPVVMRHAAASAITKAAWYPILRSTLQLVGIQLTKETVGKAVGKIIPFVGGIVSGALTFATFRPGATLLSTHLSKLPQAQPAEAGEDAVEAAAAGEEADEAAAAGEEAAAEE